MITQESYSGCFTCGIIFFFQWKVRRTLAFSIHELALVLGSEITRIELVPTFNSFLKDLDEVRRKENVEDYSCRCDYILPFNV